MSPIRKIFILFIVAGMTNACQSPYRRQVEKELAKNERHDTVFMGIRFGMTSKEFFAYCWDMNKKGLFTDGSNNTAVQFKMDTGFSHPVFMNFYPAFHENQIYNFAAIFAYQSWSPWNKALYADTLFPQVLAMYRKWLPGNDFMKMTDPKRGTIYVKIDGNRRIIVGRFDDQNIKVDCTDLLIEPELKN